MKIRCKIGCTNQPRISYRWIRTLHISLLHFVYSCFLYLRYLKQPLGSCLLQTVFICDQQIIGSFRH